MRRGLCNGNDYCVRMGQDGLSYWKRARSVTGHDGPQAVGIPEQQLNDGINRNLRRMPLTLLCLPAAILLMGLCGPTGAWLSIALLCAIHFIVDKKRRSTRLHYTLDEGAQRAAQRFYAAFEPLMRSQFIWYIPATARSNNPKYAGGANILLKRHRVKPRMARPKHIRTNIRVPAIPAGHRTFYFFPDRVLVYSGRQYDSLSYEGLEILQRTERFIEHGPVPRDGYMVDSTWQYVNRTGGPDKRFRYNPRLPVMLYADVTIRGATGPQVRFEFSRPNAADALGEQLRLYRDCQCLQPAAARPRLRLIRAAG